MKKTLLITGATGFLGSHLTRYFLKLGYHIGVLKRSFSKVDRLCDVLDQLTFYDIDKCDLSQPFLDLGEIDAIIHTATEYGRQSKSASFVANSNTFFPLLLIEEAIKNNVRIFINTDTYFNKGEIPYRGLANYSLSKKHFLDWGKHFANSDRICFANICLEHLYGTHDDSSKFTTYVIQSCLKNVSHLDLTEGRQTRDYIYVDDAVDAFDKILNVSEGSKYREYQLGTGKLTSVREFAENVRLLTNSNTILKFGARPYQDFEIMESKADNLNLLSLGWEHKFVLQQGLRKIINYETALIYLHSNLQSI